MAALSALERLDLTDTRVTNGALRAVGRLPRLERLNLSFTGEHAARAGGLHGRPPAQARPRGAVGSGAVGWCTGRCGACHPLTHPPIPTPPRRRQRLGPEAAVALHHPQAAQPRLGAHAAAVH